MSSDYSSLVLLNNSEIFHLCRGGTRNTPVKWKWFHCTQTNKCVHEASRCDLHPHMDCTYMNDQGEMIAEDEENCLQEYKQKGLIPKTANFQCLSPIHNGNSSAILSTIYNWTVRKYVPDVTVIAFGSMVNIEATRCDGHLECWKGIDESDCGLSTFQTLFVGM